MATVLISRVVMIVKNMTTPLSRTATITVHSARGRTSRSVTEMPMTSSASSSSRILREPMSEQIAEPATPESISAVMIGEAWRTTARVLPAPVNETAPTCWASTPTCSARMTPNGIETIRAGRVQTRIVYQVWSSSSSKGNRRRVIEVTRSEPSRESSLQHGDDLGHGTRGTEHLTQPGRDGGAHLRPPWTRPGSVPVSGVSWVRGWAVQRRRDAEVTAIAGTMCQFYCYSQGCQLKGGTT